MSVCAPACNPRNKKAEKMVDFIMFKYIDYLSPKKTDNKIFFPHSALLNNSLIKCGIIFTYPNEPLLA